MRGESGMRIEREYHDLAWLTQTWGVTYSDLQYLAETAQLRVSVRVFDEPLRPFVGGRLSSSPRDIQTYTGLLALRRGDVFAVLRDGDAMLDVFVGADGHDVRLEEPQCVLIGDLVVGAEERQRFEDGCGFSRRREREPLNFRAFRWEGQSFAFTIMQAKFLQHLHTAHSAGQPWVNGKKALEEIGSALMKPGDLFKRRITWRNIVDHDQKGNYRLQPSFWVYPPK